jgi:hypothetical protein
MATQPPFADEKDRAMSTTSIDNEKGQEVGQSAEWIDTVAERAYGMSISQSLPIPLIHELLPWQNNPNHQSKADVL